MFKILNVIIFLYFLSYSQNQLTLYSTFTNIGISRIVSASSCEVSYCIFGSSNCFTGPSLIHPSTEPDTYRGSIFNLTPNTLYEVTVDCSGDIVQDTIRTKKEVDLEDTSFSMQTLYVSCTGSGDCSGTSPCSFSTALPLITPGTIVSFSKGVYNIGDFDLSVSGTSTEPIVLVGQPGVIFDGSARLSVSRRSAGIYGSSCEFDTNLVVMVDISTGKQVRLLEYLDVEEFERLEYENYGFYKANGDVRVNIADVSVKKKVFFVSKFTWAFRIFGDYYHIKNIHFRYYAANEYPQAIYFDGSSNSIVSGCIFDHNDRSVALKRRTENIVIQNNLFYDSRFGFSWTGVKSGARNMEAGAIAIYSSDPVAGKGLVIRGNEFDDFFDAVSTGSEEIADSNNPTQEIDFYNNYVHRCGDDGISTDGLSSNVRIYDNLFEDLLVGISLAPSLVGPSYTFNNVIVNTGRTSNTHTNYHGMAFKFNVGYDFHAGTSLIYHNVVITNNEGSSAHVIHEHSEGWDLVKLRNNVLIGDEYAINIGWSGSPMDFDYDALYSLRDNELAFHHALPDRHLNDIQELRTQTSWETNGIELNGIDIFNDDYTLKSGSGLEGNGLHLPGINSDNPDIGLMNSFTVPRFEKPGHKGLSNNENYGLAIFWGIFLSSIVIVLFTGIIFFIIYVSFRKSSTIKENDDINNDVYTFSNPKRM